MRQRGGLIAVALALAVLVVGLVLLALPGSLTGLLGFVLTFIALPTMPLFGVPAAGVGGATNGAALQQININLASVVELEQLPGVGPATAKAIVAYREKFGAFLKVEDLLKVRGIGPAKLSEILPRARVN